MHQSNYAQLCKQGKKVIQNFGMASVEAGMGCGFDLDIKFKVMKYKQAVTRPDNNKWVQLIENKNVRVDLNVVLEAVDMKELMESAKFISKMSANKKKSDSTYHGRLNAQDFEQIAWKHFDCTSTVHW